MHRMHITYKTKLTVYMSEEMHSELIAEAKRLDRPLSWVVQWIWRHARERMKAYPPRPEMPR